MRQGQSPHTPGIHMAIYHLGMSTVSRGVGQSAIQRAAYITCSTMHDLRLDTTYGSHASKAKAQRVGNLGSWLADGSQVDTAELWTAAEAAETRRNARTARALNVALPREVDDETKIRLTWDFMAALRERYGVATTGALHWDRPKNPHAHIMITTRAVGPGGVFGQKTRSLDDGRGPRERTEMDPRRMGANL